MARYENKKNLLVLSILSAMNNIGIHAIKIRKVNGETGHAPIKRSPARTLSIRN
jgi:hypothetical protein